MVEQFLNLFFGNFLLFQQPQEKSCFCVKSVIFLGKMSKLARKELFLCEIGHLSGKDVEISKERADFV